MPYRPPIYYPPPDVPPAVVADARHYLWTLEEHCAAWRCVGNLPRVQSGRFTYEQIWEDVKRTAVAWGTWPTKVLQVAIAFDASRLKPGEFKQLVLADWPLPVNPDYSWRWKER